MILEDQMSAISILAPDASTNNSECKIPGCQLKEHDELAPSLHTGITRYAEAWTVTAILDENDGRGWEIDTETSHRRELTLSEAREFAGAVLMIASWAEIVSAREVVSA